MYVDGDTFTPLHVPLAAWSGKLEYRVLKLGLTIRARLTYGLKYTVRVPRNISLARGLATPQVCIMGCIHVEYLQHLLDR